MEKWNNMRKFFRIILNSVKNVFLIFQIKGYDARGIMQQKFVERREG